MLVERICIRLESDCDMFNCASHQYVFILGRNIKKVCVLKGLDGFSMRFFQKNSLHPCSLKTRITAEQGIVGERLLMLLML